MQILLLKFTRQVNHLSAHRSSFTRLVPASGSRSRQLTAYYPGRNGGCHLKVCQQYVYVCAGRDRSGGLKDERDAA